MKIIIPTLVLAIASTAFAQTEVPWQLQDVKIDNKVAGYIYYTSAVGTIDTKPPKKVVTRLGLTCSLTERSAVIGITWKGSHFVGHEHVTTEVDGNVIGGTSTRWQQGGELTYRYLDESRPLLQALRTGRQVKFQWIGSDSIRRMTIFDLANFNTDFSKFNSDCKINP